MELPRVNGIGLTEWPDDYSAAPRSLPASVRLLAAAVLILFSFAVVSTTVFSAGGYCLTSDGGDTRDLPRTSRAP